MSTAGSTTQIKPTTSDAWTELASRGNDGLEIALLWCRTTGHVKVTVVDSRRSEAFELDVARADALDAFQHPFAYAATPHKSNALLLQR